VARRHRDAHAQARVAGVRTPRHGETANPFDDGPSGRDGVRRGTVPGCGSVGRGRAAGEAEDADHRVADELLHAPVHRRQGLAHLREVRVQQHGPVVRFEPLREHGGVHQVAEQHGDEPQAALPGLGSGRCHGVLLGRSRSVYSGRSAAPDGVSIGGRCMSSPGVRMPYQQ
jgi:hypothetical protein